MSEKALVQCWSELQILNFTLMGTVMARNRQTWFVLASILFDSDMLSMYM